MLNQTQQKLIELVEIKNKLKSTLDTFPQLENSLTFTDYNFLHSGIMKQKEELKTYLNFIQTQINLTKSELTEKELKQAYKEKDS